MRKSLQVFLVIFGTTAITIAYMYVVFGPSLAIPGSVPVNATMDSEDRFYATLFAAYGVALLWCVKDVERKSPTVHFLAITFFAGGLARPRFDGRRRFAQFLLRGDDGARAADPLLDAVHAGTRCERRKGPARASSGLKMGRVWISKRGSSVAKR
jgi:uncharacterized protein DUF4345